MSPQFVISPGSVPTDKAMQVEKNSLQQKTMNHRRLLNKEIILFPYAASSGYSFVNFIFLSLLRI
jgi:hypothetical protein